MNLDINSGVTSVHQFALFLPELSVLIKDAHFFLVKDAVFVHRLQHVLRVKIGEAVVLFDDTINVLCTIKECTKNRVVFAPQSVKKNKQVEPALTIILPLLKREALEEVIYGCRELGVTQVYLVSTVKSSRHTLRQEECERLERISIAAAEQSKNFSPCRIMYKNIAGQLPTLKQFLQEQAHNPTFANSLKYFADVTGQPWSNLVENHLQQKEHFVICVGPEGDFTNDEKQKIRESGFIFCQLGSTILRAQQAAIVLIGLVRALR